MGEEYTMRCKRCLRWSKCCNNRKLWQADSDVNRMGIDHFHALGNIVRSDIHPQTPNRLRGSGRRQQPIHRKNGKHAFRVSSLHQSFGCDVDGRGGGIRRCNLVAWLGQYGGRLRHVDLCRDFSLFGTSLDFVKERIEREA